MRSNSVSGGAPGIANEPTTVVSFPERFRCADPTWLQLPKHTEISGRRHFASPSHSRNRRHLEQ
jgi:hypothetical protein